MLTAVDYVGYWYLPEARDERIPGTLHYSPVSGITLELAGSLGVVALFANPHLRITILGEILHGNSVTLFQCRQTKFQFTRTHSHFTESFTAEAMILGAHYNSVKEIKLAGAYVRFSNLNAWANIPSISYRYAQSSGNLTARYRKPKPVLLAKAKDLQIKLESGSTRNIPTRIHMTADWRIKSGYPSFLLNRRAGANIRAL